MSRMVLTSWAVFLGMLGLLAEASVDRSHTDHASLAIARDGPRMTADPGSRGPWRRESPDGAYACSIEEATEDDERGDDGHGTPLMTDGSRASRSARSALSHRKSTGGAPSNPTRPIVLRC